MMDVKTQGPIRVAIVGAGNVGATCAYALLLRGIATEIVLIDVNRARAEGEAMDLNHAVPFGRPARIWAGDYADCAGAQVIVLAAGTAQRPGETRVDLLERNAAIFREIVPRLNAATRDAILLIATNPVDVLTYATWNWSGLPAARVFGSGTILDTARFRYLLGQHFGVEPRSVHGFIIGEHGDSEVAVWSLANIAGVQLDDFCRLNHGVLNAATKAQIVQETRRAAYEIIRRKGATYYAVATGVAQIIEAIVRDQNSVLTVSGLAQGQYGLEKVCLSLPSVVNRAGVARILEVPLDAAEREALVRSATLIRTALSSVGLGEGLSV